MVVVVFDAGVFVGRGRARRGLAFGGKGGRLEELVSLLMRIETRGGKDLEDWVVVVHSLLVVEKVDRIGD